MNTSWFPHFGVGWVCLGEKCAPHNVKFIPLLFGGLISILQWFLFNTGSALNSLYTGVQVVQGPLEDATFSLSFSPPAPLPPQERAWENKQTL